MEHVNFCTNGTKTQDPVKCIYLCMSCIDKWLSAKAIHSAVLNKSIHHNASTSERMAL